MQAEVIPQKRSLAALERCKSRLPASEFELHSLRDHRRSSLETYIADCYYRVYHARIAEFLPLLMCLQANETSQAALGLRPGYCGPMYLENYLDSPVEQVLAEQARQPVLRDSIVEIGNLVSTMPGSSQLLFVVMTASLEAAGYRWMTFTATQQVNKLIKRLHYHPFFLGDASPSRLGANARQWGSYYEMQPRVLAGNLRDAVLALRTHAETALLLDRYGSQIKLFAQCLRDHRRIILH